jgi:hypothetical protein
VVFVVSDRGVGGGGGWVGGGGGVGGFLNVVMKFYFHKELESS